MKKTWDGIKTIVNYKHKPNQKITELCFQGNKITNSRDIARTFNDFFTNIGPNLDKNIPISHKPNGISSSLGQRNLNSFIVSPTYPQEIINIILNLDDKKSSGPHSIPVKLLKLASNHIAIPLSNIFNSSFQEGIFPNLCKTAKVIPIFKNGPRDSVNNYRPISLLPIFGKIMEKIMSVRLTNFLELHSILHPNQFGFRPGFSTSDSLISISETIRKSLDKKKYGCGVFIDLKKAFDTVNHTILIQKLEHYGIHDNALSWFMSYLKDRDQFVSVNSVDSDVNRIICGVPQGSVLGPILFLIYINDLPNISSKLKFFLFADDTNIFHDSDNYFTLERTMNKELKKLYQWLILNRLSLNISKTNFVIFSPINKPKANVTLLINKHAITEASYVKYLGVLFDSNLSFKHHINELSKKIARSIGI